MTDDEINFAWSHFVAGLAAAALIDGKVIPKEQYERARDIIAEETYVRLALGDRPDRSELSQYKSN
jgi:hypothetical protein